MRTYSIWLKGMTQMVEVQADYLNLEGIGDLHFWNFTVGPITGDAVTVAAFPFANVEYIVSSAGSEDFHALSQDATRIESGGLHLQQ